MLILTSISTYLAFKVLGLFRYIWCNEVELLHSHLLEKNYQSHNLNSTFGGGVGGGAEDVSQIVIQILKQILIELNL